MEKEQSKIVFVILHYYTINDTIKCVDSIKDKIGTKNYEIVIVDNHSPNKTGEELKKLYEIEENVHVIENEKNLGFAKGNNVGYIYAKKELKADYIVLLNNDTVLVQDNFFDLIIQEYNESEFAVLGPKIILPNNKINPITLELPNVNILQKQLRDVKLELITSYLFINKFYKVLRMVAKKIFIKIGLKKKNLNSNNENSTNKRYENIILHGCFLVFSKKYIEKFDGLDDRTFLYREEELLAIRLKKNGLKNVYNPKLQIFHNEDSATNAITKSDRKKEIFVCKNQIKSTKILLNEIERDNNERNKTR